MKRRDANLSLAVIVVVLLALLTAFAVELSNTQARSRRDVTDRVHERGELAVALIDSLFGTVTSQSAQYSLRYGGRTVDPRLLDRAKQTNLYVVIADLQGHVLAHSRGFTAQAAAELPSSAAVRIVRTGQPYGLSNLQAYGTTGSILDATPFETRYGPRVLISAFAPRVLSAFLATDLRRIPGVSGSYSYILDADQAVLGSTNPKYPAGHVFSAPDQVQALRRSSGTHSGRYYDQVPVQNSTWRLLLSSPTGPLFASVSGLRKWVPWVIFAAFAVVAIVALGLGRRALTKASEVHLANRRLGELNRQVHEANQALERRAAELGRSNAELEQFASIASHDLQEPLRKVRTFTQQVIDQESAALSDRGRDYLDRASSAAGRMQQLIEDLLRFSRVSTQGRPFEPVDLAALAQDVLLDLETAVQDAGAVVTVGQLPTINGDPAQLRQLMQNLVSNGLKFRATERPCEVDVRAELHGEQVRIEVSDNGIGFDPRYERRIFRVFERLHSRSEYPGTGIGLALSRKIVERHGGTIAATGEPGHGATFTVTLPLHQREEVLAIPESPESAEEPSSIGEETYVAV